MSSAWRKMCVLIVAVAAVVSALAVSRAETSGASARTMPSFTEISTGTSSGQYSAVAMVDVDGIDGYAEILSGGGRYNTGSPSGLYFWQYSGSSWGKNTITSSGYYGSVALADVTNDGDLDALAAGETAWSGGSVAGLVIYKGSHTGSSITFSSFASPYTSASGDSIAVGDIENDNDNDIVLGTNGDGIKVFLNDGSNPPSWSTLSLTATSETTGVAFGDLNNDGRLDVVATNYNSANSRVYLCSSSGPVSYGSAHTAGLATSTGYGIGIWDFDGDGFKDLAIGTGSGVMVYFGNGCQGADTTWWTSGTNYPVGADRRMQIAIGDINNDGRKDIAVATGYSGAGIGVLENGGSRTFTSINPSGIPTSGSYFGCCLCDWDTDGDLDMAICGWGTGVHFYSSDLNIPEFGHPEIVVLVGTAIMIVVVLHFRKRSLLKQ